MATAADVTRDILRKRLDELKNGQVLEPVMQEHIWTSEVIGRDGKMHEVEFYIGQRDPDENCNKIDLRMTFGGIDRCPTRTVATFTWNVMGIEWISKAVESIIYRFEETF